MSDQVQEIFLTQEQSKYINSMLPRGYSLQFSSSHTRRVQMNPNATKLNQYEQTLIQERQKQTRSKMNQAANAQNAAAQAAQQNKNDKDKKLQSKKENIPEREQIADSPESGNTKKRKQQEKILEKQAAKSLKQQNQVLQQVISVDAQQKGTNPVSEDIRVCFSILQQLKKSENAGPFLQKVDAQAQQCPDYYKIIRDPMDLSKVESNLKQGFYQTTLQFADDIRKIWNNSFTYNQKGSQIYKMTEEMSKLFEKIFTQVKSQSLPNPMEFQDSIDASSNSINNNTASTLKKRANKSALNAAQQQNQIQQLHSASMPITQTQAVPANPTKPEKQKKTKQTANQPEADAAAQQLKAKDKYQTKLSQDEINQLYQNIGSLTEDDTKQLYELIKDYCETNNESIELNIDNLPIKTAREVQEFVLFKRRIPSQQQVNQQQQQQQQQLQQQQIQQQKQQQPQDEQQDNKKKKKIGKLEKKDIPLTISEKKQLGINIRRLPPEDLNGIWSIVQDSQQNSEVIEFDIDTLPVRKARELEAYVKQRAAFQQKKQRVQKNQQNNSANSQAQDSDQSNFVQQVQTTQFPQSSTSTTTAITAATTANANQTPIAGAVSSFPQQTNFTAAQQYPATAYANNAGYAQTNQLIQNNGSAQNVANAKVNNNQMIQQGQYVQANTVAQQQLPIAQAATQQNMASIQGYNHLNQQQYAQQPAYQNQMMMNQYPSAFPMQQPMQNTVIGGYQSRPSQQYDAGQQGIGIPSMINQTQQPYSGQQYNQQGQAQYQGYGNNMQNMYMNQPINANTNGTHNRSIVPNQQIQYGANSQVQNGISQYPQSSNYYNSQYQSNPSQYQQHIQQMNVNQQYNGNSNQAQQYGSNIQQNQNNSEQSSEGMLSESEEE
ncbi:hypothetical protein ABPG74_010785 [Tetrahymena malaccensis]